MRKVLCSWYKVTLSFAFLVGLLPGIVINATAFQSPLSEDSLHLRYANYLPITSEILFRKQPKESNVQAIGYLNGSKLESAPVTLVSNAFAGQLAGLNVLQTNGAPRYDNPNMLVRGKSPLIIIDGVPQYNEVYDRLSLNPEQIESVTLLKDGLSSVMLGNRSMNGALLITTRKANSKQGSSFSITAQKGIQQPIGLRETLPAYEYASLYNEARINSGLPAVYSQEDLANYKSGSNPLHYPNVDWTKAVLRDNAPQSRYTLNASGNYTNVKYFLSLDYQNQQGLFNEDASNGYGTNINYNRYIFRSNIEITINKTLSAYLNLLGNIQDYQQPGATYQSVFSKLASTPSIASPIYTFNNAFAGTREYPRNPYAETVGTGYLKNNLQGLGVNLGLTQKTDKLLKGSWIKALLSYAPSYEQQLNRSKSYNAYYYPIPSDTLNVLRVNAISEQPNSSTVSARSQQTYFELSTGVERSWGLSEFNTLLLASYSDNQFNNDLAEVYKNAAARFTYTYDKRLNLEVAGAYSANNRFALGHKAGFFPGAGVSWNIHHEDFLKDHQILNEFKLRATYAKVGYADPGYYAWQQVYTSGSAYIFGTGVTSTNSVTQGAIANPNRVTEKAKKLNIGFDIAYSKNRGWLTADYFNSSEYDLLQQRGSSTGLFGNVYPLENLGKNRYSGVEISTGWAASVGKLHYSISGNVSTVATKIVFNDEPQQVHAHLQKTGHAINHIRGYIAEGFFNNQNLNAATIAGFTPSEGDVMYRDLNNDGIISALDQTSIGNDKPLLYSGLNLALRYSGFDVSVLFQGMHNRDILTNGANFLPFTDNGKGQAYAYHVNRYTPVTATTATLPRVTLQNEVNNYLTSSLYVKSASFIRLRNFEIGYALPAKMVETLRIKGVRLFINGQNLLTFSKYKDADPENYTGLYPIQHVINGGVSVKF